MLAIRLVGKNQLAFLYVAKLR